MTFGILDVAFPAFARTLESPATAGVLLSAFAIGSLVGGFLYGLQPRHASASHRYPRLCLLAGVGSPAPNARPKRSPGSEPLTGVGRCGTSSILLFAA